MSQLSKNTVSAKNQVDDNESIKLINADNNGLRIMFLGNSITLHGKKPESGWNNNWGMAASAEENDYVHILMRYINEKVSEPAFCICQGAKFELHYKENIDFYEEYALAREFGADIIIVRLIENCDGKDFDKEKFKKELIRFIRYLSPNKLPKLLFTTCFWEHPGDIAIEELSKSADNLLVKLGDLGDNKEMTAIGLFEHEGVAIHPGDKGMLVIANRIFDVLKDIL